MNEDLSSSRSLISEDLLSTNALICYRTFPPGITSTLCTTISVDIRRLTSKTFECDASNLCRMTVGARASTKHTTWHLPRQTNSEAEQCELRSSCLFTLLEGKTSMSQIQIPANTSAINESGGESPWHAVPALILTANPSNPLRIRFNRNLLTNDDVERLTAVVLPDGFIKGMQMFFLCVLREIIGMMTSTLRPSSRITSSRRFEVEHGRSFVDSFHRSNGEEKVSS